MFLQDLGNILMQFIIASLSNIHVKFPSGKIYYRVRKSIAYSSSQSSMCNKPDTLLKTIIS